MSAHRVTRLVLAAGLVNTVVLRAQDWEIGAFLGYGIYRNGSVISPGGTAEAGIRNRFVAGAVVAEQPFSHIAGEIRYLYHDGDPYVSAGGRKLNIQGQSHAVHYDVLIHLGSREEKLRPFVAAGIGAKWFRTTASPPPDPQPLQAIATLTETN